MNARLLVGWFLAGCAAACAGAEVTSPSAFDRSSGVAQVVVGTDGFGTLDGERMPIEAIVLRLRVRTRELGLDAMARFVVAMRMQDGVGDAAALRGMQADWERLLQQLRIMGVRQVEMLGGGAG